MYMYKPLGLEASDLRSDVAGFEAFKFEHVCIYMYVYKFPCLKGSDPAHRWRRA